MSTQQLGWKLFCHYQKATKTKQQQQQQQQQKQHEAKYPEDVFRFCAFVWIYTAWLLSINWTSRIEWPAANGGKNLFSWLAATRLVSFFANCQCMDCLRSHWLNKPVYGLSRESLTQHANVWIVSGVTDSTCQCMDCLGSHLLNMPMYVSFLTDREQTVHVKAPTSDVRSLRYGVPQGSIFGPLLFSIYICDLPLFIIACCALFADDTTAVTLISKS